MVVWQGTVVGYKSRASSRVLRLLAVWRRGAGYVAKRSACLISIIIFLSKIISSCSRYSEKGLVYIAIAALSGQC